MQCSHHYFQYSKNKKTRKYANEQLDFANLQFIHLQKKKEKKKKEISFSTCNITFVIQKHVKISQDLEP